LKRGEVLVAQGNLAEALTSYRSAQPIIGNDSSLSYEKVGDVLVAQGKLEEARKAYRDSLARTSARC